MIRLNNGMGEPDDIDHLGNRRIRAVGELIQMHVRTGFQRLERGIRERMTIQDPETVTPQSADQHHPASDGGGARVLRRQPACRSSWTRPIRWPS